MKEERMNKERSSAETILYRAAIVYFFFIAVVVRIRPFLFSRRLFLFQLSLSLSLSLSLFPLFELSRSTLWRCVLQTRIKSRARKAIVAS